MVYRLDAGTVIDAEGNLVIENLYVDTDSVTFATQSQGLSSGYASGGGTPPNSNIIDKFPFSSDANATDVGDLTVARDHIAGQSSSANGYASGSGAPAQPEDVIDKFPFASDANATDVGDLSQARFGPAGQSSTANGYSSAGRGPSPSAKYKTVDKFPFAADANATDVGDLTTNNQNQAGQSSTTHGYNSGGYGHPANPSGSPLNVISKFTFSSDANATDVGDLTQARSGPVGQSSTGSGYTSGGSVPTESPTSVGTIDKFPFSSDANATDVGDLSVVRKLASGQSSTANGYTSAGSDPPPYAHYNIIDKYPFSSDANASDVGDLTDARYILAGQQV